jgi:hypothetical protein
MAITLRNLNDEKYTLVLDSQEVSQIASDAGLPAEWLPDITGAVVAIGDEDFDEVWLTESAKPYDLRAEYVTPEFYLS